MEFEITDELMPDPEVDALPESVRDEMDNLHAVVLKQPAKALEPLNKLICRHPEVATLKNWLYVVLQCLRRDNEARQLAESLMQERPDYFFARTMLAAALLKDGEAARAELVLLDGKVTIQQVYPGRTRFHITEFRYWFYILGKIHIAQGRVDAALSIAGVLRQVEPDSEAANDLEREVLLSEAGMEHFMRQMRGPARKSASSAVRKQNRLK